MTSSLLNMMLAKDVERLLTDEKLSNYPEKERALSKETASAVIHAVLWAHSSHGGSFASVYAFDALAEALKSCRHTLEGLWKISDVTQQLGKNR